jgi:hypothetical protein
LPHAAAFYLRSESILSTTPSQLLRPLLNAFIAYLQPRYESAVKQMQLIIANSQHVRAANSALFRAANAAVIYPPCDTQQFRWLEQGNYYLSTARLDPLKRVDICAGFFSIA